MKNYFLTLFIFINICNLTSCESRLNLDKYAKENLPFKLNLNDLKIYNIEVPVNSQKHKRLIKWLKENETGWKNAEGSYILKVYISQKNFRLLFNQGSNSVIIGFIDDQKISRQYSKEIKKGELDFLVEFEQ